MSTLVAVVTALIMVSVGTFWMFAWLVGTNGFSQDRGGAILLLQLLAALAAAVAATWVSVAVARRLHLGLGWHAVGAGVTGIAAGVAVACAGLLVAGLVIAMVLGGRP